MSRTFSTDDLIKMTGLGYFGSQDMNALARSAFINLKRLEIENLQLKQKLNNPEIEVFQVKTQEK
jgi:hypothetical protein